MREKNEVEIASLLSLGYFFFFFPPARDIRGMSIKYNFEKIELCIFLRDFPQAKDIYNVLE